MSRRPTKAEAAAFRLKVHDIVTRLGGQPHEHYDFSIFTRHGVLYITIMDDWIACRFAVVDGLPRDANPYSGKWNFHTDIGHLDYFEQRLAGIL